MTVAQCIMTYAISWWIMLFMVLPHRAEPVENPAPGHARSAPENPRLRKKFLVTSVLAILPTMLLYLVVTSSARAEESIYHVGGNDGCTPLVAHVAENVAARDGVGASGEAVTPATLDPSPMIEGMQSVDIPLRIPSESYLKTDKYNADMSESFMNVGQLEVGVGGDVKLDGKSVKADRFYGTACAEESGKE